MAGERWGNVSLTGWSMGIFTPWIILEWDSERGTFVQGEIRKRQGWGEETEVGDAGADRDQELAIYMHSCCSSEYQKSVWRLLGNGEGDANLPCPSPQFSYVHLHGIFMYVAWGFLLPLGALLGRYYRWAWPCWFVLHIITQVCSVYCIMNAVHYNHTFGVAYM